MATPKAKPNKPNGRPNATTQDQIAEMESEGQAQNHPAVSQADGASDQDIDTAGTEADDDSAVNATKRQPKGKELEVPGDTGSADIVGPTGEQMPRQGHKGIKDTRGAGPRARKPH